MISIVIGEAKDTSILFIDELMDSFLVHKKIEQILR